MDEYIEYVAAANREAARNDLQVILDRWRLDMGMVEVVTVPDPPIYRTLRHKRDDAGNVMPRSEFTPEPGLRFLPTAPGWGVFVRDVEG